MFYGWSYVVVVAVTVALYIWFTVWASDWRIKIRREMNDSDTDANTKAIDSLLNFETVKYFGAETRETARYDVSMAKFERASVKTYASLAMLNMGQAVIFTIGLTATMMMCAVGIRNGTNTVGDFVMINAMMIQLYQPLNFMGMVYREIKQGITDIERMMDVLDQARIGKAFRMLPVLRPQGDCLNVDAGFQPFHKLRPIPLLQMISQTINGKPMTAAEMAAYQNPGY